MTGGHRDLDVRWVLALALGGVGCLAFALIWLHLGPEIVLAIIFGGVGLVALIANPLIGAHIFVMLLYFENAARTSEGLTAMKVLGPLIMTAWGLRLVLSRGTALRFESFTLTVIAFVSWCGTSLLYAYNSDTALARVATFVQLGVATLMFASVIDTARRMRQILWAMVIWTSVATIVGLINYGLGLKDVVTGPAENRNAFALFLDIAIICAFLLNQQTRSRFVRISVMFGFIPLFLLGLALNLSRGGWISLFIGVLMVWYRVSSERRFWPVLAMITVLYLITPFLPDAFWQRAGTILPTMQQRSNTFGTRVDLWGLGLRMVQDHPVLGVGMGNFTSVFARYARGDMVNDPLVAHNSYVTVAAETGLVGLTLFLLVHVLALRLAMRAIRLGTALGLPDLRVCGMVIEVSIIVVMVMSLSGSFEGIKMLWVLFGLAASLGTMTSRLEVRAAEAAAVALPAPSTVST